MQPEDSKSWRSCCDRVGQGQVWGQEMGYVPREHPGAYPESCPKVRKMPWPRRPDPRQSADPRTPASGKGKGRENKHEVEKDSWPRAGLFFLRKRQRGWNHLCPEHSGGGLAHSPSPDDHRGWARPCSWPRPPLAPAGWVVQWVGAPPSFTAAPGLRPWGTPELAAVSGQGLLWAPPVPGLSPVFPGGRCCEPPAGPLGLRPGASCQEGHPHSDVT